MGGKKEESNNIRHESSKEMQNRTCAKLQLAESEENLLTSSSDPKSFLQSISGNRRGNLKFSVRLVSLAKPLGLMPVAPKKIICNSAESVPKDR